MEKKRFTIKKNPHEDISLKNRAVVRTLPDGVQYIKVVGVKGYGRDDKAPPIILGLNEYPKFNDGELGLHILQRNWLSVTTGDLVNIVPFPIPQTPSNLIGTLSVELDYYSTPKKDQTPLDTKELANFFLEEFIDNVFCKQQEFLIGKYKPIFVRAKVLKMQEEQISEGSSKSSMEYGIVYSNTKLLFEKKPGAKIQLIGRHVIDSTHQSLISPDWDFNQMGIGGLDSEFSDIFRRAFASRIFPPDMVESLGMKHVKGILLYGPPGTGKTLIARKIGQKLHAREPKIVNGPEILNQYVGKSEANIRDLFREAEDDQKKLKSASPLHIIIFDEIDAICRTRGSLSGSTGVNDTIVNQLLSMMDGVEQLNNILVIGMTNRKDMIDEALLRPGRMEVQMEIHLPDEQGRLQILNIHTAQMRKDKILSDDVSLEDFAKVTNNYSGAEIEGLVRSATSTAIHKLIKQEQRVQMTDKAARNLKVTKEDFDHAIKYDLKPAFGTSEDQLSHFIYNGIIPWSTQVQDIIDRGMKAITMVRNSQYAPLMTMLLHGPTETGKTALATYIAKNSGITFVRVISPEDMVGFSEGAKCSAIKKVFDDAYKSKISCIVIDDIERLLEYVDVGPRFSNIVLQALLVLLRKIPPKVKSSDEVHRLLILGTTSMDMDIIKKCNLSKAFNILVEVPCITKGEEIITVLKEPEMFKFTEQDIENIKSKIWKKKCNVGIKKLVTILEAFSLEAPHDTSALVDELTREADLKD